MHIFSACAKSSGDKLLLDVAAAGSGTYDVVVIEVGFVGLIDPKLGR